MSVRLDRLQRALYAAFSGATIADAVVWSRGEVPRESLGDDVISLSLAAGPTMGHRMRTRGRLLLPADSVPIRILQATPGKRLIVRLNGFDYRHDVTALDTVATIRDALLASIQAGESTTNDITAAADGADGFELVALRLGGLRTLQLIGGDAEIGHDPPTFSGNAVLVTEGTATHLVNVQCFAKATSPRNGAWSIAQDALDLLQAEDIVEDIEEEGFAVWDLSGIADLSAIAGANWESRATFDVTLAARTVLVRPVDQIEELTMTVEAE